MNPETPTETPQQPQQQPQPTTVVQSATGPMPEAQPASAMPPQPQPGPTPSPVAQPQPVTAPSAIPQHPAPMPEESPQPAPMQTMSAQAVQSPAKKSKKRWLLIAAGVVAVVLVAIVGLVYFGRQAAKQEGTKKAQDFVALLENGDKDAVVSEIVAMTGADPDSTDASDPKVRRAVGAITQASMLSLLLQTTDAKFQDSEVVKFGEYDPRQVDIVVTSHFLVTTDSGKTGHYTVQTAKKGGEWKLYSLGWSTD